MEDENINKRSSKRSQTLIETFDDEGRAVMKIRKILDYYTYYDK